jgi:hypothetical protein
MLRSTLWLQDVGLVRLCNRIIHSDGCCEGVWRGEFGGDLGELLLILTLADS